MIRFVVSVCSPGSVEQEYCLTMEAPELPRAGDRLSILRQPRFGNRAEDDFGTEDVIVRRLWWNLRTVDDGRTSYTVGEEPVGTMKDVWLDCEMAIGHYSSQAHKRAAGPNARHMLDL